MMIIIVVTTYILSFHFSTKNIDPTCITDIEISDTMTVFLYKLQCLEKHCLKKWPAWASKAYNYLIYTSCSCKV